MTDPAAKQNKSQQIERAIVVLKDIGPNAILKERIILALGDLASFADNQTPQNQKTAADSLLSVAEALTNLSTEVRVARGNLLRP